MAGFAWVTLATNDSYSLGALVLANSLRQVGTSHQLAVLVTPGVTNAMREQLRSIFNVVVEVNILDSKDEANLRLLQRPELGVTFTKLHCWRLTQFEKCVFLDADTLVLQNADELFEREELSAAPDVGWPDCFNSGVFVYRPSNATYENLVKFALERGSFDGGDQGLLNLYFSDWAHKDISKHLPFIYNTCSTASYSYLPAFKQFGAGIKIIHFIGPAKPWLQYFDTESRQVQPSSNLQHLQPVLQHWWDLFFSFIQPKLSSEMARSKSSAVHNPQPYPQPFYTSFTPSPSVTYEQNTYVDYRITTTENESGPESDYRNVWDPWEEYEQNTDLPSADHVEHSTQLIVESITNIDSGLHESHNTNAHSVLPPTTTTTILFPTITPPPIQLSIPTFHHPSPSVESNTNFVEMNSAPERPPQPQPRSPPPPLLPPPRSPSPQYIPVENQCSYANNNSAIDIPPRIQTPPHTHQIYAQPHEFEPLPCTVANESILHPNDNGSHNNDGDAGLAGAFSQLKLGEPRSPGQLALEDHLRRQGWEVGNIDYLGKDSFENIWKKICQTIDAAPKPKEPTPPPPPAAVSEAPTVPPSVAPETVPKETQQLEKQEQIVPATAPVSDAAPAAPVVQSPAETQSATVEPAQAQTSPEAAAAAPEQVQTPPAAVPADSAPAAVPEQPPAEPSPVAAPITAETPLVEPAAPTQVPAEPAATVTAEAAPEQPQALQAAVPEQTKELPTAAPGQQADAPPALVPEQAPEPSAAPAPAVVSEPPTATAVPEQIQAPPAETQAPSEPAPPTTQATAPASEQPQPVAPSAAAPAPTPAPEQPQSVAPSEAAPAPAPAAEQPQPAAPSEAAPAPAPAPEQPQPAAPSEPAPVSLSEQAQPAAPSPAPPTPASASAPAPADVPKEASAETAKAAAPPKTKEGAKKSEGKPVAEPTSPTPPPRKAGSSPKKTKAKK